MKRILLIVLLGASLVAQDGAELITQGQFYRTEAQGPYYFTFLVPYKVFRLPDFSKRIEYSVFDCGVANLVLAGLGCGEKLKSSDALSLGAIQEGLGEINNQYAKGLAKVQYVAGVGSGQSAIVLDGLSDNRLLDLDLGTFAISHSVVVGDGARLFALRPAITGREVWTAHAGTNSRLSFTDLDAAKLLGTLPLSLANADPAGLVFNNSGTTAYYAARYFAADANGKLGALLTIDAASRKVTATMPLTYRPDFLLMAPDGLTAYIIGGGKIVYFDIMSGTADLVANFPAFPSSAPVLHPDSRRIFVRQGSPDAINVFDVQQLRTVAQFALPFTAKGVDQGGIPGLRLSQDGHALVVWRGDGEVLGLSTIDGSVSFRLAPDPMTVDVLPALRVQ